MQQFGTAEVSRLADIPVSSIRAMIRARYVSPTKTAGLLRFSFQDLVVLRTARQLLSARVSRRLVGAALRKVRAEFPVDLPPRGLSVTANGGRILVHEAGETRDALSGQLLLELRIVDGKVELINTSPPSPSAASETTDCDRQFAEALALEDTDIEAAVGAYRACVSKHRHLGACANLGRLLHLQGRISEAVEVYRSIDNPDADLLYNLAVALEDLGFTREAIACYERVLAVDPAYADAHHNVARLWQQAGDSQRAVRHWNAVRRLTAAPPKTP